MWYFTALAWTATAIQIILLTLAVATGLFYLAELVEEYTATAKRMILWMTYGTAATYAGLLLFETMPLSLMILGLLQQFFHILMLKDFPYVQFKSPVFVVTSGLLVINHYLAFGYFGEVWHPFNEVLGFFTICLWLVPFAFFVSLSANDNTLPSTRPMENSQLLGGNEDDVLSSYFSKKQSKMGLLSMLKWLQDTLGLSFRSKKSF